MIENLSFWVSCANKGWNCWSLLLIGNHIYALQGKEDLSVYTYWIRAVKEDFRGWLSSPTVRTDLNLAYLNPEVLCSLGWRLDLNGDTSNQFFDLNLLLPAPRMTQIRPANQEIQELHMSEPTRSLQPRRSSEICHFGWVVLIKVETTGQNCLVERNHI